MLMACVKKVLKWEFLLELPFLFVPLHSETNNNVGNNLKTIQL